MARERVDAHQHFWALARGDYGWLTSKLAPIFRDYGPADLAPLLQEADIVRTVLVQAAPTEAETDYLLGLAGTTRFVAGVVGWVDLESPDAARRVAHAACRAKLVGLRPMIHDIADDRWMLRPEIAPAIEAIVEADLVLDALVRPRHLPALVELVGRHPALRVVIDHAAKPDIARWKPGGRDFRTWARSLEALGARGLSCKLSGLATEASPGWRSRNLRPYSDALLAAFGPNHIMWGSDWPVVELAGGYRRWCAATEELLEGLTEGAREAILGRTAARVYRLPQSA